MANTFFFPEKLRHDIQMHSGSETAPDRRWCRDAQGTPAGAQTDPPTTNVPIGAQVKSTATEIERKIFHLCGLLVRLHRPMRWHEMTWDDMYKMIFWSWYLCIYIFHVDLRCFTRQTYPRTPRFDRYLWPISSYWPTEFRGAASWDVSIFLKLWSFAIIWYHLITIRSLIRTVDQQSFAQFVICWRISSVDRFNYPVLVF